MRIIGIDPSLTATGIAYSHDETFTFGGDAKHGDTRLLAIYTGVRRCTLHVDLAVIEDLPTHGKGAGITGMAQGAVRFALLEARIPYITVTAATLKKYATGKGSANKADMRIELYKRVGLDIDDDNQVDAWWLRALGYHLAGQPIVQLPQTHTVALAKVKPWPGYEALAVGA